MGITDSPEGLAVLRQARSLSRMLAIVAEAPDRHGRARPDLAHAADRAHKGLSRLLATLAQDLPAESPAPPPKRGRNTARPSFLYVVA